MSIILISENFHIESLCNFDTRYVWNYNTLIDFYTSTDYIQQLINIEIFNIEKYQYNLAEYRQTNNEPD